jgi:hypothetical protein
MTYGNYLKQLCKYVLSSSVVLAIILGTAILFAGEGSMNLDMDFDFGALDGVTIIFGLPLISVLLVVLLSPLSFWFHKLLSKKDSNSPGTDA